MSLSRTLGPVHTEEEQIDGFSQRPPRIGEEDLTLIWCQREAATRL